MTLTTIWKKIILAFVLLCIATTLFLWRRQSEWSIHQWGIGGVLASSAQARDSQRTADMQKIYAALKAFYKDNGFLPTTRSYGEENPGGWDYSSQGDFLPFLRSKRYLSRIPKDPINNGTGDVFYGGSGYSYAYYCYGGENSLSLGAKLEGGKIYWIASHEQGYMCK